MISGKILISFYVEMRVGAVFYGLSAWQTYTGARHLFVTRGPGALNAAIGVHTARQDSSPIDLFVGQVGTALKGREAFQEIDYETAFRDVAKWSVEINEADRIPEIIQERG